MRRALALTLLLLGACATPAAAQPGQPVFFDAPDAFSDPAKRAAALDEVRSLGGTSIRVILYWNSVAPSPEATRRPAGDPSSPAFYDFSRIDAIIAAAKERGMQVLVTPTAPAPRWATEGKDGVTRPRPEAFGQFMRALGAHLRDEISLWAIWNEPNHPQFLRPQTQGGKPTSPRIYRALFLAGWRALRATGNARDTILAGETAPQGGSRLVMPLEFLRGTLCLDRSYRKRRSCANLPADGWAHHPYSTALGPAYRPPKPDAVTSGVLSRLVRALDRAADAGAVRRGIGVWITEFGVETFPDRQRGVPVARAPGLQAWSEHLAYRNPRIKSFAQYLLFDDARPDSFQSGLRFADGRAKPGLAGWRLPLDVERVGRSRSSLWGLVRPARARTRVEIQRADRGRAFRRLRTVTTDRRGAFTARVVDREGRRFRLRWTAPSGRVFTGAPVAARR